MTVQFPVFRPLPHRAEEQHRPAPGLDMHRLAPDTRVARTRTIGACALLVIDGTLLLSSYRGRERLERGMLAIQPSFDARALCAGACGASWLQFPWQPDRSLGASHVVADVDALMLLVANDLNAAQAEVAAIMAGRPSLPAAQFHWVDGLHRAILATPHLGLADWARQNRVSREAAARRFRQAYDVRPSRFRLEIRARNAWARISASDDPLSLIALEAGFADQSHMTRAVGWFTGRPPNAWRSRY